MADHALITLLIMHWSGAYHALITWLIMPIQSEVSQKENHQYSILTHIYGISKNGNNDTICKTERHRYKSRLLDSVGEEEGGMI